ncbi:ribosome-inactivating protein [Tanacetum coccineum]
MRLFLATLLVLLAAVYLHLGGVEADNKNIFYYNNGNEPNIAAYVKLLEELQSRLASETDVRGIAVTRPPTNITFQECFIQVQLENGGGDVITAFPNTAYTHRAIGFDGSYSTLGNKQETKLGHDALNNAITNLFNERSTSNSKKRALLVIIQMVAEAVRIRWSDPSEQIQWSGESGVFLKEIQVQKATKFVILYTAGTIMNPRIMPCHRQLTIAEEDNNSSRQAWSAGNYTQPTINYISGFREMCLQANGANALVWLANCVIGTEPRQQLYGDRTIWLYSDRTLCVTSDGDDSLDSIILLKCQGSGNQRWTFMADGTI